MMRNLTFIVLCSFLSTFAFAQNNDKMEFGLHLGHAMVTGDLNYAPGFGGGLHLRKAIDHVFSLRADLMYANGNTQWNGDKVRGDRFDKSTLTFMAANLQGVATLSNIKWLSSSPVRKTSLYVFAGLGPNYFGVESELVALNGLPKQTKKLDSEIGLNIDAGIGFALRLSPKMNIALEHKVSSVRSSNRADLLDGVDRFGNGTPVTGGNNGKYRELTQFPDILHYTNVRLAFNIGKSTSTEPLYWVNPMATVLDDIAAVKARPVFDLTDTDGDGVIDMLDQEKESPAGAQVDTRGLTLDSDNDGIANYKDKEPFSPIGFKIDGQGIAVQNKAPEMTEGDVNRLIDTKLKGYQPNTGTTTTTSTSIGDWFLPMIHFDLDRYNVKTSEYAALRSVATVLKNNPSVRVLVSGYTDRTAANGYNQVLSFNRAQAAIDHLTKVYGIDRSRLVLTYGGEDNNLVPTNNQTMMNRRVEFKVAQGESDMTRPAGRAGRGNSGGRAGY